MADWQESLPAIQRPAAINSATVKNRMETRRQIETLKSLDRDYCRSLRRINSVQENLVNSRHLDAAYVSTRGKRNISKSYCSLSSLDAETGSQSSRGTDGKVNLDDWHVQGRDSHMCGTLGVESTLTKSFVVSVEQIQDPVMQTSHLEFPPFAEKEKAVDENKLQKQKAKHKSSSGTFHLIPGVHNPNPKGMMRKALTPPMRQAGLRNRIASYPNSEMKTLVSTICHPRREQLARSHSFSHSAPSLHNRSMSSVHSPALGRNIGNHQLLKVSKSLDSKSSSVLLKTPSLFPLSCFCPICHPTANSSIIGCKEEFAKLTLADQMEIVKGSRYLRLPTRNKDSGSKEQPPTGCSMEQFSKASLVDQMESIKGSRYLGLPNRSRDNSNDRSSPPSPKTPSLLRTPCSCPICQPPAKSSINGCNGEFSKVNLADQLKILEGNRYLQLPTGSKNNSK